MIPHTFEDGSILEQFENGDIVEVTKKQTGGLGAEVGEWGQLVFKDLKDKERGHTDSISFVSVQTAGVSTPKDSFQQCISSIPVWDLKLKNS